MRLGLGVGGSRQALEDERLGNLSGQRCVSEPPGSSGAGTAAARQYGKVAGSSQGAAGKDI